MKQYSNKFLIGLYRTMLKIRLCEESFVEPILRGDIRCPVHLCSGEEAVAVGVCSALAEKDCIFGGHRSHGHYLAKGGGLKELVSEVYGKKTGCSRGRGGSMHIINPETGMLGSAPIVAGTISLALGAALASKIRKQNMVVVSFFGDGATGEGVLYESLNFASLKKLPIVFVCENNLYSTHMPIRKCRPNNDIYKIAEPFDILSFVVDGNNVVEVYEAAEKAVAHCRQGDGPVFIECKTYRLRGHVGPDDNIQGTHTDIRPEEELAMWRAKDPVEVFGKKLVTDEILNNQDIENIKKQIEKEIEEAFLFADTSAYPDESEVMNYVFK
ncbi:MAG: thiamine pyrophosphate-dependent dehydrogenase E1 component subunit alpha [Pseudomonadota bacterium]